MKDFRLLLTVFLLFGGLFQAVGQSVPSYVPTNGLVGWWPFNGNAQDASGNGNHGTVNGATLTTDRFGNQNVSYSFDGLDDFIEIPSSVSLHNPQGTINLWLYTTIPNRDVCPIKKTNFSNAGNEHYVISITPTQVVFANKYNSNCQSGNGWFRTATSNSIYTSPSWHMITATYSTVNNLYIDGILVSTKDHFIMIYTSMVKSMTLGFGIEILHKMRSITYLVEPLLEVFNTNSIQRSTYSQILQKMVSY